MKMGGDEKYKRKRKMVQGASASISDKFVF